MAYLHQHRVRFQECDPAGIVYFAQVLTFCHEAYEDLLRDGGQPIEALLAGPVVYPLKRTEADYSAPLRLGDLVQIRVAIGKLSERSFRVDYMLSDQRGALLAKASTAHVAVDRATMRATQLPAAMRAVLEAHLEAAEAVS